MERDAKGDDHVDPQQFRRLRARWRFAALILGIGTAATVFLTLAAAPTYGSRASVWLTTPPTGGIGTYQASAKAQSYANLSTGAKALQQAAERLNSGLTAGDLERQVSATVITDTVLVQVEARADTPELAQEIATVVSDEIVRLVERMETPSDPNVPPPIVARVASGATLNPAPLLPNIPLNLVTGIGLSLLAGVAGAILREALDLSVKGIGDVEAITGHTPMATLPFDPMASEHPHDSETSAGPLGEAFRVLRTNITFANLDAQPQIIMVTSSLPDEGKTFVATNLAISIAKGGHSVLLLDSDLRNPGAAKLMGLENSVGLMTVLLGRATLEEALQQHVSGVTFLGTGPQPPNPAEVLDTQAMRSLLAHVREAFDVVIVDSPPLLPVADAAILLTEVDGALLLARHGTTRREELRRAVERVQAVGGKLLGTVVNGVPLGNKMGDYGYYRFGYDNPNGDGGKSTGSDRSSASMVRRASPLTARRSNPQPSPVSSRRIAGWCVQTFFAAAVPLILLPPTLGSVPFASAGAFVLVVLTMAATCGPERTGSGLLVVAFGVAPLTGIQAVGLELSDVFFIAGFLLLIPRFARTAPRLPTMLVVGEAGFLAIGSLAAMASGEPGENLEWLLRVALGVTLLTILLAWWQPGRRATIAAAAAYLVGNIGSVAAALFEGAGPGHGRYDGWSTHPNQLAVSLVLAIALAAFLFETLSRKFYWIIGIGSLICVYGIWISGSRAALVCAMALALLYPLHRRSISAALTVAALCIPAMVVVDRMARDPDPSNALGRLLGGGDVSASDEGRREGAQIAIDQFFNHPLLGHGWEPVWGAHNIYLQIAASIGIFGIACYLLVVAAMLRPLVAVPRPYGLLAAPALAAALIGLMDTVVGGRYIWCVAALALSAERLAGMTSDRSDRVDDSDRSTTTGVPKLP